MVSSFSHVFNTLVEGQHPARVNFFVHEKCVFVCVCLRALVEGQLSARINFIVHGKYMLCVCMPVVCVCMHGVCACTYWNCTGCSCSSLSYLVKKYLLSTVPILM